MRKRKGGSNFDLIICFDGFSVFPVVELLSPPFRRPLFGAQKDLGGVTGGGRCWREGVTLVAGTIDTIGGSNMSCFFLGLLKIFRGVFDLDCAVCGCLIVVPLSGSHAFRVPYA